MQYFKKIQNLIVDMYNAGQTDIVAETMYSQSGDPLVERAEDYLGYIKSAKIPIANLILDPSPNYKICLFSNIKTPSTISTLDFGPNYFNFSDDNKQLLTIDPQFNTWLSKVLLKSGAAVCTLLVQDDEKFSLTIDANQYTNYWQNASTTGIEVYMSQSFKSLLPDFLIGDPVKLSDGNYYYLMSPSGITGATQIIQNKITVYKMMKAEQIRIYSSLPVTPWYVYNKQLNELLKHQILGTINLNQETMSLVDKSTITLTPTLANYFSLEGNQPVNFFSISVCIYYSSGETQFLTIPYDSYLNIGLSLVPREY